MILEYAIQVILFQLAFLLVYDLLLKKETFFSYNRWYLIFTPTLALLLPLLKIRFLTQAVPPTTFRNFNGILLPEVVIGANPNEIVSTTMATETNSINWLLVAYIAGIGISLIILALKFRKLQKLTSESIIIRENNLSIYKVKNSNIACTFFDRLFIGEQISNEEKEQIMAHEMVHIKERHSLDLIFFEILKVILWFNPLIYLFQNRLATVHEFIADETAVKVSGKRTYYEQLLNSAFGTQNISFINQFFSHSLIKKRIIMLQKHKSSKLSKFKFLLIIPLMLAMLTYVACSENGSQKEEIDTSLSQYSYTLQNGEGMTPENQTIHEKYEEFLKNNPDYVSWATIDYDANNVNYSVHSINEQVPEGYNKMEVTFPDGTGSYVMYMNLKSPGTKPNQKIMENSQVDNSRWDSKNEVPFGVIDKAPAFKECDQWVDDPRRNCTSNKIADFVNKNFDTSLGKKLGLTGVNRVIVQFRIDETGNIVDIKARAPHAALEDEAKRVISELPKMIPGEQNGKPVSVMYSLPIAFKVAE